MNYSKISRLFFQSILAILLLLPGLHVMAQSPPTAVTGAASETGSTDVTLNGTVNANGAETTVTFEYGLNTGYGFTFPAVPGTVTGTTDTATSAVIYELSPNTTYHYRVVAQNANGTTYGADMTFTTLPSPPSVLTNAAASIAGGNATLNGTVNAHGISTTVTFEYGTDTNYGTTVTADQSPVSYSYAVPVSKTISGLASNTTYHYRVAAVSAGGTTYGSDMTFTTGAVAPTATTNASTAVGNDIATLNGTVNAQGSLTTVTFEYGLDTAYGTTVTAIQSPVIGTVDTAVSVIIEDILPNTTYHYRVVAVSTGGTTYGADMTFTTLPLPPTAVTNAASAVGIDTAALNGTVNAQDSQTTVTFQYGTDTSYGSTVTADQSPLTGSTDTAVSTVIAGLSTGITYHYRVAAVNAGGTTYGADMTFTTGTTAPTATTNAVTALGTATATLNGTVNANNDTTTVTFQYGLDTNYDRTVTAVPKEVTGSSDTSVSVSLSALSPGTTYHYRVAAVNAGGTTYGADMTFSTRAAPTVTTQAASAVTTGGATLNGIVNANNDNTTVTFEYGLTTAYGATVTADQSPVSGTTDTAVGKTITGLTNNTIYHYRVVAQNVNGATYGADMTFTTTVGAPTVTTNAATSVLNDGATLNGLVSANNADTTVTFEYGTDTSYGITVTADQSPVAGVNAAVSKAISGLNNNTTYHYRVVGQNSYGTTYGADMTFKTSNAPTAVTNAATGIGGSFATLNGLVNANNFNTSVSFQYGTTTSYGTTVAADPNFVSGNSDTAVSKAITGLLPNTTYHFRVVAQGYGTAYGADMTFTTSTGPTATTNAATAVGATNATFNGTVNANGADTTVTFEYGQDTNYNRVITANQSPLSGSGDTAVNAIPTDLIPNTTYHYRVVAQNTNDTAYGADMSFTTIGLSPTATTNAATGVTASGAILKGTVNANNSVTGVTFEYGPTTAYGTTVTADQSPVSGTGNTVVDKAITGLTADTTYHYRVVAQNSSGTTYGGDRTFYTGSSGPTATTEAASSVGTTTATLNGTVNANNNLTTVTFEYGPTAAYGRTAAAAQSPLSGSTATAVNADVDLLTPDTTYHYRVVAQNSADTTYGADMTFFTGTPTGIPTVTTTPVYKITIKSAKSGGEVIDEGGAPVTVRGVCWSATPNPTIADNTTENEFGPGVFVSTLIKLTSSTTYYVRAYATNSHGTAYGEEFQFTTDSKNVFVRIVKPHDGKEISGTVSILALAWTKKDKPHGNTKSTMLFDKQNRQKSTWSEGNKIDRMEFFVNDTKIAEDTKIPYKTDWDTTSYIDGSYTIKAVGYNSDGDHSEDSVTVTVNNQQSQLPVLSTNRDRLVFKAVPHGHGHLVTRSQLLLIRISDKADSQWSISTDADWLSTVPQSGNGSRLVLVYADPTGKTPGTYSDSLTITAPDTSNVTVTVDVHLIIREKNTSEPPFGSLDSPVDGSRAIDDIPISGWALDDIEVKSVTVYRDPVGSEGSSLIYVGEALIVDGARPDVEDRYPDYPLNYQTGWGYLLKTDSLPNKGHGTFTFYAKTTDKEGNTVTLGSKTITIDKTKAVKPFGAIDRLTEKTTAAGPELVSYGWALTPQPNTIPGDGSTITVWVDGLPVGNPVFSQHKKDIARLFPGYKNSLKAGGYFTLNTTAYTNGIHTLAWSVKDDAGNINGIDSRYFSITNTVEPVITTPQRMAVKNLEDLGQISPRQNEPVFVKKGYKPVRKIEALLPDEKGISRITIKELEWVELEFGNNIAAAWGYLVVDSRLRDLPTGSTLDYKSGRFSWSPGPGYLGEYPMVFVLKDTAGQYTRTFIQVTIEPKY